MNSCFILFLLLRVVVIIAFGLNNSFMNVNQKRNKTEIYTPNE